MNIVASQTGIDVAKDELVVSIDQGKPFALPNDEVNCRTLVSRLSKDGVVHVEASGGYERLVCRVLRESGIKVVLHNPLKPRRMAQAQGTKAKTDSVDAKVLSRAGSLLPEAPAKAQDRQQLADHSRAIDVLKENLAQFKKRMKMPELDAFARELYAKAILDLEKLVAEAEKAFAKRIKLSAYANEYKLIQSVPALGPVTARKCVCEIPEDFHERSTAEIASYAGLAPIDNQSGKRTGQSKLGHGNSRLKGAFYMSAMSAITYQQWAKELYTRLKAKGKNHQQAIVPIMRRLLVRAVAVLKRGSPWQDEPQKA